MSVFEYDVWFFYLIRYAPDLVATKEQRNIMFRDGMKDSLKVHLILTMKLCPTYRYMLEAIRMLELNE